MIGRRVVFCLRTASLHFFCPYSILLYSQIKHKCTAVIDIMAQLWPHFWFHLSKLVISCTQSAVLVGFLLSVGTGYLLVRTVM